MNIWQVFAKGVGKDLVVLMAARASRMENQDAIDCAIVSMLADPKEVQTLQSLFSIMLCSWNLVSLLIVLWFRKARAGIKEVHFLPFNPTDKRTALTYIDGAGNMHRVSKGAPEQVIHNSFSLFKNHATYRSLINFSHILCRFSILHKTRQKSNGRFMRWLTSLQNVDFVLLGLQDRFISLLRILHNRISQLSCILSLAPKFFFFI